tara:strand:+ start:69 stop:863 length:795 start_codon:yes stop_codon:yes gene_type:complete
MNDKIFSMPVRVNDFIANTVNLKNEELGIYWRLLCFAWESKALLCNDKEEIYEISKAHDERSKKVVDKILEKFFILDKDNCYYQKAQQEEWKRVNELYEIRSEAGKRGGQANNKQNESKSEAPIPIPIPILKPNNYTNKKIKYSVSFEKFWEGIDSIKNRSTKSDSFKQWSKLSEEDRKDIKEKWDHYKKDKGDYYKACERFLAKRIFDEISLEAVVVNFDPLFEVKKYVSFVERGQHMPMISDDMVDKMLEKGLISQEIHDKW